MNIIKHILWLNLLVFILFTGCKDDLSSLDTNKLPDISVDTTGQASLSVFQFDKLVLDPKVQGEAADHQLSYEWRINLEPKSIDYITIGTDKKLDYQVSFTPTTADKLHQILLKITDEVTGLEYLYAWPLTIRNSTGEGLIIVESYDGVNTDLSHVMSPLVTPDYTEDKIRKKIYSSVNGNTIPGLVNNLIYTQFGSSSTYILLASTPSSLLGISTLDYTLSKKDVDFFYAAQPSYGAGLLKSAIQNDVMVQDGKLYANWLQIARFGLPFTNSYTIPSILGINNRFGYPNVVLNFYSEEKGHFAYQSAISSFGDRVAKPVVASTTPFNPNSLPSKTNIAAGINNQGDFIHLLKDKTTSKFGLYILDGGGFDDVNYVVTSPKPKQYVDLSNAPEIDQAIDFVILDNQQVMLYATKTKIYGVVYSASTPTFGVRYTLSAGEEVTDLRAYYQADYPKNDRTYFGRNGKQLILSTYNGSEGKVHILPLVNEGLANIDQANIKTYSGFGKILFTTTQL